MEQFNANMQKTSEAHDAKMKELRNTTKSGGGGGGSCYESKDAAHGGIGGGGRGGSNDFNPPREDSDGKPNTGGGAGGLERWRAHQGAAGGPGIIIVKYNAPNQPVPVTGAVRYNTDSNQTEVYQGSYWEPIKKTLVSYELPGQYTFQVPPGVTRVEVLVVAGGGSGGGGIAATEV